MDQKVLLFFPCGLIAGSCYLSAAIHSSFALDRPLHTIGALLLLSGLAIVAHGILTSTARPPRIKHRYVAIPLRTSNGRPASREASPAEERGIQRQTLGTKWLAGLVSLLLAAICARMAIYQAVMKHVECAAPTATAFLPLVLALFHGFRDFRPPNSTARGAQSRQLERALHFAFHGPTRYILPSLLLSVASFLTTLRANTLPSTYVCPLVASTPVTIHQLQFLGFLVDCTVVLLLYRLIDDGVAHIDNAAGESKESARNTVLIGSTLITSALILAVTGLVVYAAFPEHREWLLTAPPDYLQSLFILCFTIPCTILCFLWTARRYGLMSTLLIPAFSVAYTEAFRALQMGVSFAFPPKPTTELATYLLILTIALISYLVVDTTADGRMRPKVSLRLGRYQITIFLVVLFVLFFSGLGYRPSLHQSPVSGHPITALIKLANDEHDQWSSQARRSTSLAEAVKIYQQRYSRDPPPGFDKWYEFATARNSVIIDDFDNIEEDLAPFSSLSAAELRKRTAQILAEHDGLGGISIRNGRAEVFSDVPGTHRWMVDGAVRMIEKFAEFLPDMDLAMNLNDECRVAVPFEKLRPAHAQREVYPNPKSSERTVDFSPDRGITWLNITEVPRHAPPYLKGVGFNPTFQSYGSIACPPNSPARRKRHWNTAALCTTCAAPHSMGAFVSNWSLSASPCHQPDLANLHGFYLSPSSLVATHDLVPIFSQSRAPGYADIRYPSPWNYMDKAAYGFDEKFPDPPLAKKENTLFWRGTTSEGVSAGSGAWKGMLRQRLVHLLNNETYPQPILLPNGGKRGKLEYVVEDPKTIKRLLATKMDVRFVDRIVRCGGADCTDQAVEFGFGEGVDFKQHWRYRYLFDADGAGFSGRFIPFLQSNSIVFKTALFREWYEGRLTAWRHFVPVDLRLHDLFSSVAYFGGYSLKDGGKRAMDRRDKEAEAIARAGRVWAMKVLRKEDMEVYFFRLLLEWGRLTDERRREVGFRTTGKGPVV